MTGSEEMAGERRVFLTGGTGFIGGRVARLLAERGHRLRFLVAPEAFERDSVEIARLGGEWVVGDITDREALLRGIEGADLAFHIAGKFDIGVVDRSEMARINVEGTRAFLEAMERVGTPRGVYVSSTSVLTPPQHGEGDESTPVWNKLPTEYQRSKAEAHRLASQAQERGLPLIIVCPAYVYGPDNPGPGGRYMADLLAGRVPGLLKNGGWFSYVHVDDVAEGVVLSGEAGRPGATYILSGEHCSMDDFTARVAKLGGRRAPKLRFPVPLARFAASVLDGVTRVTGIRFPLCRENVEITAGHRWVHSYALTERELGWKPRSLDEGLPEAVASLLGTGAKTKPGGVATG